VGATALRAQTGVYDAQQEELNVQRSDLSRQIAVLDSQSGSLSFQRDAITAQIEQERMLAEYQLQIQYYNVCLLIENGLLLDRQTAMLDKSLQVEQTKLALGETTQNAVDVLQAAKTAATQTSIANRSQIEYGKAAINLMIDAGGVTDSSFVIPESIDEKSDLDIDTLQNRLVNNNYSVKEQNNAVANQLALSEALRAIGGQNDPYYLEAAAQASLLSAKAEAYKSQLLAYAGVKYSEYVAAEAQYSAMVAGRSALLDQLGILDALFSHGEISELEHLSGRYDVQKSLVEIKTAIVAKANSLSELDLLANGIVLNAG
jgi:outer membrane protein TolC